MARGKSGKMLRPQEEAVGDPMGDTTTTAVVTAESPQRRANANLLGKLEASRLHALEALSSVLFEVGRSTPERGTKESAGKGLNAPHRRQSTDGKCKGRAPSLQERLRRRATRLVQRERDNLLRELHAELDLEREKFEARKSAMLQEAYRAARKEQAVVLEKQEREFRMVLARRELKHLKDATRERLALAHAQEKEKTLARLRRSLGRGTGHSVSGLREELWEEANEKRNRALHEGEAAFEHSCRLLRQQSDNIIQTKIQLMAKEAALAEESALFTLHETEGKATIEELDRVAADLERDKTEAEAELKRHLHREAAMSIALAVEACTSKHKQTQQEATTRAAETLRRLLEAAGEDEVARTKAVLGREARMMDDRRFSLIAAVEDGLKACSLRNLAKAEPPMSLTLSPPRAGLPRPAFLPSPNPSPTREIRPKHDKKDGNQKAEALNAQRGASEDDQGNETDGDLDSPASDPWRDQDQNQGFDEEYAASAARAVSVVRRVEGTAAAAEREYAKRARGLVHLRATAALRERNSDTLNHGDIGQGELMSPANREQGSGGLVSLGHGPVELTSPETLGGAGEGRRDLVGCGSCALLFEANERLLQEARARGFRA